MVAAMKPLKAHYAGYQQGIRLSTGQALEGFTLWTILEPIPGHPVESTLAESTILDAGYQPYEEQP
jgi:hypothetical protein